MGFKGQVDTSSLFSSHHQKVYIYQAFLHTFLTITTSLYCGSHDGFIGDKKSRQPEAWGAYLAFELENGTSHEQREARNVVYMADSDLYNLYIWHEYIYIYYMILYIYTHEVCPVTFRISVGWLAQCMPSLEIVVWSL